MSECINFFVFTHGTIIFLYQRKVLITFDKGGIKRQIEFCQPYQHKRFFEPRNGKKSFFRPILGGLGHAPPEILKITFSRLAETDFPGIKFTKKNIKTARIAV